MIVIGAGPAGLITAKHAASEGVPVQVWEEHSEIGVPTNCTGLVSKKGLDLLDTNYENSVLNEVRGARLYSPSGKEIEVDAKKTMAFVLDRELFDKNLAEEAQSEGAEIIFRKKWSGEKDEILVGADGAFSSVARSMGIQRKFIHTYQIEAEIEKDPDFVELHFGFSPGFFTWITPINEKISRIGCGVTSGNPKIALNKFLRERRIRVEIEKESSALIPLYDGKPTVFKNTALVGDAAAQVKATTGGGIAVGGFCARILGEVIARNLPLTEYEKAWRTEFQKELETHLRIHNFQEKLSNQDYEELFEIAEREGLIKLAERFGDMDRPARLLQVIMSKPSLVLKLSKWMKYF